MATDDTRSKILNAAGAAFADRGFEKATIREIASIAGVNLASVNYHFGDKEQLYLEVIRFIHNAHIAQAPLPDWPADTPPEIKLRDFIRTTLTRMLGTDELTWKEQLVTREMLEPSDVCRKLAERFVKPQHELLLSLLDELLPESTPAHRRHQLAFSLMGQCVFYRSHRTIIRMVVPDAMRAAEFTVEQITDHITEVMLAALGRASQEPDDGLTEGSHLKSSFALER